MISIDMHQLTRSEFQTRARASHPMCSHLISLTIHAYIDISKLNLKLYSTYWANASKYPMFHAFYRTVSAGAVLYVCVSIQRSHRHDLWGFAPIYSPGRPCLRRWRSLPSSFPLINDHHPDTYHIQINTRIVPGISVHVENVQMRIAFNRATCTLAHKFLVSDRVGTRSSRRQFRGAEFQRTHIEIRCQLYSVTRLSRAHSVGLASNFERHISAKSQL